MRKNSFWILFISLFFIAIGQASAFQGDYSYDINKVSVSGSTLSIEGWAAINKGGSQIHNINPTYTFQLVGKDDSGREVIRSRVYTNANESSRQGYTEAGSTPRDYTKAYFMDTGNGPYPSTATSERGRLVAVSAGNYYYINLDFRFNIPISEIKTILNSAKRVYMDLTVKTTATTITRVFGYNKTYYTTDASTTIHVGVQQDRVNSSVITALGDIKFNDTLNKLTNIVTYGYVQGSPSGFIKNNYRLVLCSDGRILKKGSCSNFTNLYYLYNRNYTIDGSPIILSDLGEGGASYYYYPISVDDTDSCYGGKCVSSVGGGTRAYLPAFWANPISGVLTYLTGCPTTGPCPGGGEENNPCDNITDPQKHYCCVNKTDPICSTPDKCTGESCFPTQDPSTNKTGTCKTSGTSTLTFKYPSSGFGKQMLKNNACTISCSEQLTTTFQPQQPVRAGMGFTYPVNIKSSRYCTADYDNPGWKTKVDNAATAANTAYNNMVAALNSAASKDSACGSKTTLTSVPSCSCGSRSGMSCHGCTCSRRVFSHYSSYSCGSTTAPSTCYRAVYKTEYYTCTKSASCPSGYSYRSSLDRCARDVCSRSGQLWSSAQSAIASDISRASSYRSQYNSYTNTVNTLKGERSTCDNYISNNKYNGATSTNIATNNVPNQTSYTITSSSTSEDTSYEGSRKSIWTTYQIYQCNNRSYSAPYLIGESRSSASAFTGTYCNHQTAPQSYRDFWNKKSDSNINLEFATTYYIQRYTGTLSTYSQSGYDYHGRYAYTDFYAKSVGNSFSLALTRIGPNIQGVSNTLWSINPFNCQYNVTNKIFPPTGDSQNDLYGNTGFTYRQISLTDPFPGRSPKENWNGKTSLITNNGYKIYGNVPRYNITLDPGTMQSIRGYGTNYGSFYVTDPYRSPMVESYTQSGIIVKGK